METRAVSVLESAQLADEIVCRGQNRRGNQWRGSLKG